MDSNNWFFDQFENPYTVQWSQLSEEQRYGIWSIHMDNGGQPMLYPMFCDILDAMDGDINA